MFERVINMLGLDKFNKITNARVCVCGIGGVGGYVCEGLVRSGIINIDIVDCDIVSVSNINRQIIATTKSVGLNKVDVMRERLLSINPNIKINAINMFLTKDESIDVLKYDYVIDCIDNVSAKLRLISDCVNNNVFIISSMGTADKLDPTKLEITRINKTSVCPLARVMRYELKKRGITNVMVLYSKEEKFGGKVISENGRNVPSGMIFVPASAGLMIASYIIRKIIGEIDE